MELLIHAFYGLLGGFVRGLVGFYKDYKANNKANFNYIYFLVTVLTSSIIGAFVAFTMVTDYRISILAGYAGIDLLENIIKIYNRKK
ncbi:MAG: hypothetical protein AABW49_01005 [Nanoarchaeota archaeon]